MKRILMLAVLLAGCEQPRKLFVCTDQQRAKAESEAIREIEIRESSSYGRDVVFDEALARNCKGAAP